MQCQFGNITTTHLVAGPRLTTENIARGSKILTYNQQTRAKIIPNVALLNNNAGGCWLGLLTQSGLKLRSIPRIVKYADVPC